MSSTPLNGVISRRNAGSHSRRVSNGVLNVREVVFVLEVMKHRIVKNGQQKIVIAAERL